MAEKNPAVPITTFTPTSTVVNSNGRSRVWDPYVSLENDVFPWLQLPQSDASNPYTLTNLTLITQAVCSWAQKRLGKPIAPHLFQHLFDGDGYATTIMLPYPPVLEIVTVVETWGMSGDHVLDEATPDNQVFGFECQYSTGRLVRMFHGLVPYPWFPGVRNIYVEYWAGQNPIDPDLKMATLEMIAHWYRNTQQQSANRLNGAGASAEEVASGLWQGTPLRILGILDEEIHIGIG